MTFTKTFHAGDAVQVHDVRGTFRRLGRVTNTAVIEIDDNIIVVPLSGLRHAPVRVVGSATKTTRPCPECHGILCLDREATKVTPRPGWPATRQRRAVWACTGCEYLVEA